MLASKHKSRSTVPWIDTPNGIFTSDGIWFHTREKDLIRYTKSLVEHVSLKELVRDASIWVKSGDALSIYLLTILGFFYDGWLAIAAALTFFVIWLFIRPALVSTYLSRPLLWMSKDMPLILLAVFSFSRRGNNGEYIELTALLITFLVFKFSWLSQAFARIMERSKTSIHLINDRILKMLILRSCQKYGVENPELEKMEKEIINILSK